MCSGIMYGVTVSIFTIGIAKIGSKILMENPTSWHPTQKKINLALKNDFYSDEQAKSAVNNILAALKANELLKRADLDLCKILCEEINDYQSSMMAGRCGVSLTTRLYNKLIIVGAL
jgi:hypothetical protein